MAGEAAGLQALAEHGVAVALLGAQGSKKIVKGHGKEPTELEGRVAQEILNIEVRLWRVVGVCAPLVSQAQRLGGAQPCCALAHGCPCHC